MGNRDGNYRLRYASKTNSFNRPLSGAVELDESVFGGKDSNKHKSKRTKSAMGTAGKTIVFGMLERGGEIRAKVIKAVKARTVRGAVFDNTVLLTDEHVSYKSLDNGPYQRFSVNHSAGEYGRGPVHINGIEGVWSLFKRQVYGIHHHISAKHPDTCLGEMCYRYSRRALEECERVDDLLSQVEGRLTHKALIDGESKADLRKTPQA